MWLPTAKVNILGGGWSCSWLALGKGTAQRCGDEERINPQSDGTWKGTAQRCGHKLTPWSDGTWKGHSTEMWAQGED